MSATGFPPSTALPAFDNTLGALLIGGLLAMGLWGVTCVQTFRFFTQNTRDALLFKFLIAFLWALDTFDSLLNGHILYSYLVINYLNPQAIFKPIWSVIIHVAITSISNFIIRTLFARRFYRFSQGNLFVTGWIMAISFTDLVCGIVITAKAFKISTYLELEKLSYLLYLDFAAGTTSDFSVALALSWILVKSRTGFARTNTLINVLMAYTVNTGLLVSIDAALGMITYAVMPHNFIFLAFYLLLSKLYLNSYLAMLNARDDLRVHSEDPVSIQLSQMPRWRREHEITTEQTTEKAASDEAAMEISVNTFIEKSEEGGLDHSTRRFATPTQLY